MPREAKDCRRWEKDRRDRLNIAFDNLEQMLPHEDPPCKLSKIDVLDTSAKYIKDLKAELNTLNRSNSISETTAFKNKIKFLNKRITRLHGRNGILLNLLKHVGIKLPSEYKYHSTSRKLSPRKPSNKERKFNGLTSCKRKRSTITTNIPNNFVSSKKNRKVNTKPKECFTILKSSQQPLILSNVQTVNSSIMTCNNTVQHADLTLPYRHVPTAPMLLKQAEPNILYIISQTTNVPPPTKILPRIQPKHVVTTTTQSNKLQIPALKPSNSSNRVKKKGNPKERKQNLDTASKCGLISKPANQAVEKAIVTKLSDIQIDVLDKSVLKPQTNTPVISKSNQTKRLDDEISSMPSEVSKTNTAACQVASNTSEQSKLSTIHKDTSMLTEKTLINRAKQPNERTIEHIVNNSELSNDIFATLDVPTGGQNIESTSPTAAYLISFPLVSRLTGTKIQDVIDEEACASDQRDTPTILQIGTMDTTKPTSLVLDGIMPNIVGLDNYSFFGGNSLYHPLDIGTPASTNASSHFAIYNSKQDSNKAPAKTDKMKTDTVSLNNQPCAIRAFNERSTSTHKSSSIKLDTNKLSIQSDATLHKDEFATKNVLVSCTNTYNAMFNSAATTIHSSPLIQSAYNATDNIKSDKHLSSLCPSKTYITSTLSEYNTLNPFNDIPKTSYPTKQFNEFYNSNPNCSSLTEHNFMNKLNSKGTSESTKTSSNNPVIFSDNQPYNSYTAKHKPPNAKTETVIIPKPPVNWMTTPDPKQLQTAEQFTNFAQHKDSDFYLSNQSHTMTNHNATSYFSSSAIGDYNLRTPDLHRKHRDLQFHHTEPIKESELTTTWPNNKPSAFDNSNNYVPSLPTLVGDLALGTQGVFNQSKTSSSQYVEVKTPKEIGNKCKESKGDLNQFEMPSTFLSVSQLVDHDHRPNDTSAKVLHRRNSNSRSKSGVCINPQQKLKKSAKQPTTDAYKETVTKHDDSKSIYKQPHSMRNAHDGSSVNVWNSNLKMSGNPTTTKISYSAEALIGNITNDNASRLSTSQQYNYHLPVTKSFASPDNMLPYFPSVELPTQDTSLHQQSNSNIHGGTFNTNFPVTSYASNSFGISSTSYLQTPATNYLPDYTTTHDYGLLNDNLFHHSTLNNKQCSKQTSNQNSIVKSPKIDEQKKQPFSIASQLSYNNFTNQTPKKTKRISSAEQSSSIVDMGFLSAPATCNMNSPILPDDFCNFLPQTHQFYPCKTNLYSSANLKNESGSNANLSASQPAVQHSGTSHSCNIVGNTLTNFNLSNILPEINKQVQTDNYTDCSNKNTMNIINFKEKYR